MHDAPQPDHGTPRAPAELQDPTATDDREIEALVIAALSAESLGVDSSSVHAGVRQGIVTLTGLAYSAEARTTIGDTVAAVPGVRAVENHLHLGAG